VRITGSNSFLADHCGFSAMPATAATKILLEVLALKEGVS
jgi:hypothetical protein